MWISILERAQLSSSSRIMSCRTARLYLENYTVQTNKGCNFSLQEISTPMTSTPQLKRGSPISSSLKTFNQTA